MNITSTVIGKQDQFELRKSFIKWQCRVRQIAMRENGGKPDEGIIPIIKLETLSSELGSVITLIHKLPKFSVTAELIHMSKKTMDPAQRRDQAVRFLSSAYYQKHAEFSDLITATFEPNSKGAKIILQEAYCILMFEAFSQRYDLHCTVRLLKKVIRIMNQHLPIIVYSMLIFTQGLWFWGLNQIGLSQVREIRLLIKFLRLKSVR